MRVSGADRPPPARMTDIRPPVRDGWDVATVVVEFEVVDQRQSAEVAERLFATEDVLTVRVGGAGERSVYRVDVPRGSSRARTMGAEPAVRVAETLDIGLTFVRIGITPDGLGDPEGEPPSAHAVPWAARRAEGGPSSGSDAGGAS